jgi:hypothetical protein
MKTTAVKYCVGEDVLNGFYQFRFYYYGFYQFRFYYNEILNTLFGILYLDYLLFGILLYPTSFTVFHWFHSLPIYYGFPSVLRTINHFLFDPEDVQQDDLALPSTSRMLSQFPREQVLILSLV